VIKAPKRRHPVMQLPSAPSRWRRRPGVFIVLMFFAGFFAHLGRALRSAGADFGVMLAPPSWDHWMGTDAFGRDVFSRIIYGARTALAVGFLASLARLRHRRGDRRDLRLFRRPHRHDDPALHGHPAAFPIIVLALPSSPCSASFPVGGLDLNLIIAIAIPMVPKVARVVRSSALAIRELPYIDAARAAGYGHSRIIFRHMAPNVVAPFLIMFTAFIAQAILLEASLSFLGLGVTEPTAAWGLMLSGTSQEFYSQAPWMIIFPGVAISLAVFAFNMFGDSLRDYLDPRLKV
jgi:peptide/nickel transport system permease protein